MMFVLRNVVRHSDHQDLLSDVTLDTANYTGFAVVDIMTGVNLKVDSFVKDGNTILKMLRYWITR